MVELSEEHKEQIAYEMALSNFFQKNYGMLLATFLEENHDKFMEHVENKYEDHKGEDMKWVWDLSGDKK